MPAAVSFELTNNCNLKCPECVSGSGLMKRKRGFMDALLFEKTVAELRPYLYYISLYFQGEPMMHPDFFSLLNLTRGIKTIVSTNGHFLTVENSEKFSLSGLYKLIVSLDGVDQKAYSEYRRNGDLGKVVEGIRNISSARKKLKSPAKLELQFLVNRHNEHQIREAESFAREIKAQLKLKSMQVLNVQDSWKWMPSAKEYARYEKAGGKYVIRNSMPSGCLRLWLNPVITWDGKVLPCCFDKDAEFIMGDLTRDSFRTIWNSTRYAEFRERVLSERKSVSICRNCTSGMRGIRY
jgi:radical SAM protein with 4Fe4S-binding SPASM domain